MTTSQPINSKYIGRTDNIVVSWWIKPSSECHVTACTNGKRNHSTGSTMHVRREWDDTVKWSCDVPITYSHLMSKTFLLNSSIMYVQSIYMWRDSSELRLVTLRRRRHARTWEICKRFRFAASIVHTIGHFVQNVQISLHVRWWKRQFNCEMRVKNVRLRNKTTFIRHHSNDCMRQNCDIFYVHIYAKGSTYVPNQTKQTANECIQKFCRSFLYSTAAARVHLKKKWDNFQNDN